MLRVGVNGFGSIGRRFYRAAMARKDMEIVAVNDLTDPGTLAHLLKYDSNYGTLPEEVACEGGFTVGGRMVKVLAERERQASVEGPGGPGRRRVDGEVHRGTESSLTSIPRCPQGGNIGACQG